MVKASNILALAAGAMLLMGASCDQQYITVQELIVYMPPEVLFNCPLIKTYPDTKKLRDSDIAKLVVDLTRNNEKCAASINAIRADLQQAALKVKKKK